MDALFVGYQDIPSKWAWGAVWVVLTMFTPVLVGGCVRRRRIGSALLSLMAWAGVSLGMLEIASSCLAMGCDGTQATVTGWLIVGAAVSIDIVVAIRIARSQPGVTGRHDGAQNRLPNSEAVAASIDWRGDGVAADDIGPVIIDLDGRPTVTLHFEILDRAELVATHQSIYDRLRGAGLISDTTVRDYQELRHDSFFLRIHAPFLVTDDLLDRNITINLSVETDDADAAEALQPLVNALGTLD